MEKSIAGLLLEMSYIQKVVTHNKAKHIPLSQANWVSANPTNTIFSAFPKVFFAILLDKHF